MPKTIVEILTEARASIARRRRWWKKNEDFNADGRQCAAQAIYQQEGVDSTEWAAMDLLIEAAGIKPGRDRYFTIFDWNDDPTVTHEMVLEGFDKAISLAVERGV